MKNARRWTIRSLALVFAISAMSGCSEAPTQPDPVVQAPSGSLHTILPPDCDPTIGCQEDPPPPPPPPPPPASNGPLYLTFFQDVGFTGDYYEIRQNVYRADGTRQGYNAQRWHGNSGNLNVQILDRFPCGGHIDVAMWRAGYFNSWTYVGGVTITAYMN